MNGREVVDDKWNKKCVECLEGMPDYMTAYLYSLSDGGKTALTKYNYILKINKFLINMKKDNDIDYTDKGELSKVKPYMISRYLEEHVKGEGSAKATVFYAIRNFFNFLEINEIVDKNPMAKMLPPKDNKEHEIVYLTQEEIKHIYDTIRFEKGNADSDYYYNFGTRDMAVIMTMLYTGLRRTSIYSLDIDDVDLENHKLRIVEKGNKIRYIMISDTLVDILDTYLHDWSLNNCIRKDQKALFIGNKGNRINQNAITRILDINIVGIDKHITAHKLRSTYATAAIKSTGNIYLVANQLGHKNIRNTARYAAIDDDMKKEAAAVMDDILF